jgi:uncharacterized protein YjbJ (UPF0337 family)
VKEAAGALSGDRHLKNKGRGDQAKPKGSAKKAFEKVGETLTGSRPEVVARACVQPTTRTPGKVTMLAIIIILLVLLVLGGYGFMHRGRHAFGFSRRGRSGT